MLALLAKRPWTGMAFEENGWFGRNDSAVLFSMLRKDRPQAVIEVGCGNSTRITLQALRPVDSLTCIDPAPRIDLPPGRYHHLPLRVEQVNPGEFTDCDLLFIDSSHVWAAGDLPFLYEQVFPVLKAGCLIHSHDIFLPDAYPPAWDPRRYDEQYHLAAFLEAHPEYETLWPAYYMATRRTQEVIDIFGDAKSMGSFWMVKTC
jgi:hypothetical protein